MTTTREMLGEATAQGSVADTLEIGNQVNTDAYEDLRNATPEQLCDAMIWFIRQSIGPPDIADQIVSYLLTGWRLAQPDGWQHVAPMWLQESKKLAALNE